MKIMIPRRAHDVFPTLNDVVYWQGYFSFLVTDAFLQAIEDFNRLTCIRLVPRTAFDREYINLMDGSG